MAEQGAENTEVANTQAQTDSISAKLATLAGQQVLSHQLVDQSPAGVDQIVLADLAGELAKQIDRFALSNNEPGKVGLLATPGVNVVSYTATSPTPAGLYAKIADGIQQVSTNRFAPPDAIIMHPRRFAWLTAATDSTNRPLVVPTAQMPSNVMAAQGGVVAEGLVGSMQGLAVYVDPNVPTNLTVGGSGDAEDVVIVARTADLHLWETPPRVIVDRVSLANQLSIRVVLFSYVAVQCGRYPKSISLIEGSGLNTPAFGS